MTTEWRYSARLVRVVDGDTLDLRVARDIDFGFRMLQRMSAVMRFRIVGVDTPEKVGRTHAIGLEATRYVERVFAVATDVEVLSLGEPDKYGGRWDARVGLRLPAPDALILAPVTPLGPDGRLDLAELLVLEGYAMPYSGQGPRPEWNPALAFPLDSALRWRRRWDAPGTWLPPVGGQ